MKNIYLECGRVVGAHGVRGAVKVEPWCDTPRVLAERDRVFLVTREGEYQARRILGSHVSGGLVVLTIEGLSDREAAIAARGTVLYLHRDDIPVAEGEMLLADMIGLPVVDAVSGRVYGSIKSVDEVPRGIMYTIATEGGDVLFPHVDEFVKEIDEERGLIITPIPGFFD